MVSKRAALYLAFTFFAAGGALARPQEEGGEGEGGVSREGGNGEEGPGIALPQCVTNCIQQVVNNGSGCSQ